MNPVNVLHIFYHYPPVISGYAKRSHEIIRHTAPFAKSVIITPPLDPAKCPVKKEFQPQFGEIIYRLRKPPLPPIKHIGHRFFARVFLEMLLRKIFKEHPEINLVHAHMPFMQALPALQYAKSRGLKTIYEVRGVWEDSAVAENKIGENSARYQHRRQGEELAMQKADKVVVLSQALKREVISRGIPESKVELVENGVDCSQFTPRPNSNRIEVRHHLKGKTVLGYIGTLRKLEGIQTIFPALTQLLNQNEKVAFLIVGYGEYEPELRKMVKESNLEGHVIFAGAVSPDEAKEYYSAMDLVLFPRLKLRVTDLVTPLKPLEAMAMGKCVLGTRVGGLTEYLHDGENAVVYSPDSPEELVKTLKKWIQDTPGRRALGEKARRWVEANKDWKMLAEKYRHLYLALAGKPREEIPKA